MSELYVSHLSVHSHTLTFSIHNLHAIPWMPPKTAAQNTKQAVSCNFLHCQTSHDGSISLLMQGIQPSLLKLECVSQDLSLCLFQNGQAPLVWGMLDLCCSLRSWALCGFRTDALVCSFTTQLCYMHIVAILGMALTKATF